MNNQELEAQWAKDIDNISMMSETSMDEDALFHELINAKKKHHQQFFLKNKKQTQEMISLIKNNEDINKSLIQEFENDLPELQKITRGGEHQLIPLAKIQQIRQNITANIQQILIQEEVPFEIVQMPQEDSQQQQKLPTISVQQDKLQLKMERMFQERELLQMQREDQRSMRVQIQTHEALFDERFYTPELKTVYSKAKPIQFGIPCPCFTYTNLAPQMNNQQNTFSKHSPIIAIQALKKVSRTNLKIKKSTLHSSTVTLKIQDKVRSSASQTSVCNPQKKQFPKEIMNHFANFSNNISKIQRIVKVYEPKFLNDHLDENQKGQNFSLEEDTQQKSFSGFLEIISDYDKVKELNISFQKLKDIQYIETLKNLECVVLRHNNLKSIQPIINNQQVIELNLAYNKLQSMQGIQYLKYLRYLNLQHNEIQEVVELQCEHLEVLLMKHNSVRRVGGLNKTCNLRTVDLSHNKLQDTRGFNQLYFLDNLNICYNKVQQIKGIGNCLLLKSLTANDNKIKTIQPLAFIFMNKLILSRNQIQQLPQIFLPSLQQLYLDYNKLTSTSSAIFIPQLKILNCDYNKFRNFSPIWNLIKYSVHCEVINYSNNEELSYLPGSIVEMYEFMVYNNMGTLRILNHKPFDIGTKRYYESHYKNIVRPADMSENKLFQQLSSKIRLTIDQNRFRESIESRKHQFRKDNDFIRNKTINMVSNLKRICSFIQGKEEMFVQICSVFHRFDLYEFKKKIALQKITTLIVKYKYKKTKRAKYFKDNLPKIKQCFYSIEEHYRRMRLVRVVSKFSTVFGENNKHLCANKIKSSWVTYKNYTHAKKLISKMKTNLNKNKVQDEDQYEEIDLDFLDRKIQYSSKIQIPSYMNFQNLIYKPELFQKAQEIIENAMIYEQSDTSSHIGSMENTSSTNNHSLNSLNLRNKSKKKSLPPMNIKQEAQKMMSAMKIDNDPQVMRKIQANLRMKQKRKAQNAKDNQYLHQRFQNKRK